MTCERHRPLDRQDRPGRHVGGQIDYTLTYANSGANNQHLYHRYALPLNVSYIASSQSAPTVLAARPIEFSDLGGGVLQWKLPLIGTGTGID